MTTPRAKAAALETLKRRFFRLASKEDLGNTPAITAKLDDLQTAIKELQS